MSQPLPDRIDAVVDVDTMVQPEAMSLFLRVNGSATLGTEAAVRKGREVAAIHDLLQRLGIASSSLIVQSVTFEAAEGWLSGSSAQIGIELRKLPLDKTPEIMAALSTMKGVALHRVRREYGALREQRDALLHRGVTECLHQARVVAQAAGIPLLGIHSLQQAWTEPEQPAPLAVASMSRGGERARSAVVEPQDLKGFQLLQHHEARLALQLRMSVRVGEFAVPPTHEA